MRLMNITLVIWTMAAYGAMARDIFVDNVGGDDGRDGGAPVATRESGPFRTIARALRAAQNGDRIILADTGEPYRESITLQAARHSGHPTSPFTIVGNGAVLEGLQVVPDQAWRHYRGDVFRFLPSRLSHCLLYLDNRPAPQAPAGSGPAELQPLQWRQLRGYVYFRVEQGRLPQHYNLSYTALPVGITLYEVRHVAISDLVIQGFQLDGVNAHDGVSDALLVGLVSRGNGRSGVSVGGASRVRIEACLVGNNGAAQVRTEGQSHTQVINCDLLDNTAPALVREGGRIVVKENEAGESGNSQREDFPAPVP